MFESLKSMFSRKPDHVKRFKELIDPKVAQNVEEYPSGFTYLFDGIVPCIAIINDDGTVIDYPAVPQGFDPEHDETKNLIVHDSLEGFVDFLMKV